MTIRLLQIDTFTDRVLGGNPAAVCPLDAWLDEATMQAIAAENNLSETAFLVPEGKGLWPALVHTQRRGRSLRPRHPRRRLRRVRRAQAGHGQRRVRDAQRRAHGRARRRGAGHGLSGPARQPGASRLRCWRRHSARTPAEVLAGADWIAVFENAAQVADLSPDHAGLTALDRRGVVATAPGDEGDADYVLRFFAPKNAVPEDPVTGNVQTALVPYWAGTARQATARRAPAFRPRRADGLRGSGRARVSIAGRAVLYMDATISVGD